MKEEDDKDGKLQADLEIKASLGMNRKGFKWKTLINDPETGSRYQIMQMNKPKDLVIDGESAALVRKMKYK
jgi:hypothetical protein